MIRRSPFFVCGARQRAALLAMLSFTAACPTRGMLEPFEADDGSVDDRVGIDEPTVDGEVIRDVPGDQPQRPPCAPYTAPMPTDPCPGRADCGFTGHGTVTIRGATAASTDMQVLVNLPAAVRSGVGAACDHMVFRTTSGQWAPHFVTNCMSGVVWVKVPALAAGMTTLQLHYGGGAAVPAANSYDDTFERVPLHAQGLVAAYSFDEGTGSRTCPSAGNVPFDAYIHQTAYDQPQTDVTTRPDLWSNEAPTSLLAPGVATARFTRNQHALNFPRHPVLPAAGVPTPNRLVNWRSASGAPFNTVRTQLTVGIWVYAQTPANAFGDNFQTVVCYGMPELQVRQAFMPDAQVVDNSIFNPWAIFFRSDDKENTYYQGNSCVEPCTNVMQYAHITTRAPLTRAEFTQKWHFMAITVDELTTPHATRRSYLDDHAYSFPTDLDLFPEDINCPMGPGMCRYPPDAPIQYYPGAPVLLGADMNDGEAQLGLEGKIDDFFILSRAASAEEMRAIRERRQYTADTLTATVTP